MAGRVYESIAELCVQDCFADDPNAPCPDAIVDEEANPEESDVWSATDYVIPGFEAMVALCDGLVVQTMGDGFTGAGGSASSWPQSMPESFTGIGSTRGVGTVIV